ncbi:MAG: hypothetical protein A3C93_06025 [Candidatus Lloydbacteria bacterium RIFCSPHIGHO2_02_FULL_54_17]|uniref:DUF4430 domain-containing protein n=1 Tax=Candidatus Lloydbacteria bacterium RIFCSPHIGHO2_02_FULL_54_17 TaxID=1798664 RepID=A0A1G2DE93_9BACT|nr:MAG: hypothetical protein A2762_06325 [Candidatus Lloydbacteria bacterium RIFCSPHIGHO2_01_FULL_54_11]OGZ11967.1 MAG: hypothetical protein A3C93_06025 [Candidatus Lloydbacteria bacterium RIFCSPHIGHO2_02_FULL_54_17]OGZ14222.1 MAG: hypothetical protein A2948_02715 [Candidatus Lloydbacteria bacterium RIFCSPLOWO2_01_FULL_54_18]
MANNNDRDARRELKKKISSLVSWAIGIGIVGGLAYLVVTAERLPESEIESAVGIHYHPRLVIKMNGEPLTIPNNIGIGAVHNPIHTHEEGDGTLHLEFEGTVKKDDIRLGDFFTAWNKEWTATSFMGSPVGGEHTLTMTVNGAPSTDYWDHIMKDGEMIELDYK